MRWTWTNGACVALLGAGSIVALSCGGARARVGAPPSVDVEEEEEEAEPPVLVTKRFVFYSRPDFNEHDRLLRWATGDEREGAHCVEELGEVDRAGWERAVRAFEALGDDEASRLRLRLRFALVDPSLDFGGRLGEIPAWYREALDDGAAAYRACWWREDDRRNREWIDSLARILRRGEEPMASRIARWHGLAWDEGRIPVDVVPYQSAQGANTVVGPHHVLIGSTASGNGGYGALEVLFHEASHTIVSPRSEGSVGALRAAAERLGIPLHEDLWHTVLFFTAGHAAEETVRELWSDGYEQYLYGQGLLDEAWPEHAEPLESFWRPYLEGELTLEDAAEGLVRGVGGGAAEDAPVEASERESRELRE